MESRLPAATVAVVGFRLRIVLFVLLSMAALLGANSAYLAAITLLEWLRGAPLQNFFYQWMFMLHLVLGMLFAVPLVVFAIFHMRAALRHPNAVARRVGLALLFVCLLILATGLLLTRMGIMDVNDQGARRVIYWLHVACPIAAVALYLVHRKAGPPIRWRWGLLWSGAVAAGLAVTVVMHGGAPQHGNEPPASDADREFAPALSLTARGGTIPAKALMNDQYCKDCHADVHERWAESAHRFSSFNNPAYDATVQVSRRVAFERDGHVKATRFCAGCHDPVPLFSGRWDDPKFDGKTDPTAHAGITCTVCHSITAVNSARGNADYTIEEPAGYPFAYSENPVLKYINHQLIKAKPEFHKRTYLKPQVHRSAEFCSTCHKVFLPGELTKYKDFLRGQNHYDSFLLSGVSGHGVQSFYYPPVAKANCNECHMPPRASDDFAARMLPGSDERSVHDHLFPGANTALPHLRDEERVVREHQQFLKDCLRVDIFGVHQGTDTTSPLIGPLRPDVPELAPGKDYVIKLLVRTLTLGHHFTQGTADSNEVWIDVRVKAGDRIIARSGQMNAQGKVDPWAFFINAYVLDRQGEKIEFRNAQDIFVPLYDHQIPPGAARLARYQLHVPEDAAGPITIEAEVKFRKFNWRYMQFVMGDEYRNDLPVTVLASDRVQFPLAGDSEPVENSPSPIELWQRWNDYGIAFLVESGAGRSPELVQAEGAFAQVERLGKPDGPLNLARVYLKLGRLADAASALSRAGEFDPAPTNWWTLAWLSAEVNARYGRFDQAVSLLRRILQTRDAEMVRRGLDFSFDYRTTNQLGQTLYDRSKGEAGEIRVETLHEAAEQFRRAIELDAENVTAHHNLALIYGELGQTELAQEHRRLHGKYKPDENARDLAIRLHRQKNPAADHAANVGAVHLMHPDAEGDRAGGRGGLDD